jgi:hypothetical protein
MGSPALQVSSPAPLSQAFVVRQSAEVLAWPSHSKWCRSNYLVQTAGAHTVPVESRRRRRRENHVFDLRSLRRAVTFDQLLRDTGSGAGEWRLYGADISSK